MTDDTELQLPDVANPARACGCGCTDEGVPELDARRISHSIRHAASFGALGAIQVGGAPVLVAPHDPVPLLAQIADREAGAIAVSYLQRGPNAWRLRLTRTR